MPFATTQVTGEYATYTIVKTEMIIKMNSKYTDGAGLPKLDVVQCVSFAEEILEARTALYPKDVGKYYVKKE